MKKLVFILFCLLININVYASSGSLKSESIVTCDETYGYHGSDKHYHKAVLKNGNWYASGKNLGTNNPCSNTSSNDNSNQKETVSFYECVDGDTAKLKLNNQIIKVRFLAIDTPETKHPTKKEEPYGKEASDFTCKQLKSAKKITIEYDSNSDKYDKYDRHLVWIFVDDNLLQKLLIKEGLAEVDYLYDDYKYTDILLEEEKYAKENKVGLWSEEEPKTSFFEKISNFIKKIFA